ncbi:hypothetical protein [Aeoliella sp. SH292]|uniref:hypothetical protein n=1 Tax=Aeoliella sp. SH292 TaxID=3454464 RepID=UPI003F989341
MKNSQPPTTNPLSSRLARLARWGFVAAWLVNGALLVAAVWWIAATPDAVRQIDAGCSRLEALACAPTREPWKGFSISLATSAGLVVVSGALMLLSVLVGPGGLRSMRQWLLLVLVVAAWLTLGVGRHELSWRGQQHRIASDLKRIEPFLASLSNHWPTTDGDSELLGPFLAYPRAKPTTLLLAGVQPLPGTNLLLNAIEKTADGAIRLELGGEEHGGWIEWRPAGDEPSSFVSGLETAYSVRQRARLAPDWYLVRYDTGRATGS